MAAALITVIFIMITWDPFRVPEERGEQVSALSRQKRKDKSKQICLEIA